MNTTSSKTKKHRPKLKMAVKRRLKLRLKQTKPKAVKEKGALEKHFNRTIPQKMHKKPKKSNNHSVDSWPDEDMPDR